MKTRNSLANNERLTERKTVIFTKAEMEAIAKKAIASHLKVSQVIRILALKSLGVIQTNLFN